MFGKINSVQIRFSSNFCVSPFTWSAPCWLWSTWLGGARCVVIAGVRGGRRRLDGRRGGPGGGFVHADLRLELWKAPPPVDVLKLLNLDAQFGKKKGKSLAHASCA